MTTVAAVLVLAVAVQAAGTSLLSSSAAGTYEIRYWKDRALVSYSVDMPAEGAAEPFTLQIALPEPMKWVFLDSERMEPAACAWTDEGQAKLTVPRGEHSLQVGWAGKAQLPPEGETIPVLLQGEQVGELTAEFALDGMEAFGNAALPEIGQYRVRVNLAEEVGRDAVSVTVGSDSLSRWGKGAGVLAGRQPVVASSNASVTLRVSLDSLMSSPVESVELEQISGLSHAVIIEEAPENGIKREAENYDANHGSNFQINPGSHFDTSGGSCVYSFKGDGTWLEWDFDVPEAGKYDLLARITLGNPESFRRIEVSGQTRPDLTILEIPGTGGWGHAPGEWQIMKLAGTEQIPALELEKGSVSVKMVGILESDMNIDWIMLAPHSK